MSLSPRTLFLLPLLAIISAANAEPSNTIPNDHPPFLKINGKIRSYYFARDYSKPNLLNQDAFSLGGSINILTMPMSGFRLGATAYTAQSLGLNSEDLRKVDRTLPGDDVTVLGQAFLQYENPYLIAKIGDQLITSPWLNEADSRMIPAAYQGLYVKMTPIKDLNIISFRTIRFKNRIASNFSETNLYTTPTIANSIKNLHSTEVSGALAVGSQYQHDRLKGQIWGYQFYDFAKLIYGDVQYKIENNSLIKPFVGAQLAKEWSDGDDLLRQAGVGDPHARLYGALVGAEIKQGTVTLGYNVIPKHHGAFQNGNIVSPYTNSYVSDPLYTSSMIAGLIEKAAGSAFKVTGQYAFFAKKLQLKASYAKYSTSPFIPNTIERDVDVTYTPDGIFKNLSLRYRVGVLTGHPQYERFTYHRLMTQYEFE